MKKLFTEQHFDKTNYTAPERGEYNSCTFTGCDFSNAGFDNFLFLDSEFVNCNLSLVRLKGTALRNVRFKKCKVLGVRFDECNDFLFEAGFEDCVLDMSSFYKRKLKKTIFRNCSLKETDFAETDLTSAIFDNCILTGALFENSILEKADFRTAASFSIDPEKNRMKKAKFSVTNIEGLLDKHELDLSS